MKVGKKVVCFILASALVTSIASISPIGAYATEDDTKTDNITITAANLSEEIQADVLLIEEEDTAKQQLGGNIADSTGQDLEDKPEDLVDIDDPDTEKEKTSENESDSVSEKNGGDDDAVRGSPDSAEEYGEGNGEDSSDLFLLRAEQNNVITKIEALLQDGSGPVGDVGQWQVFRLNAEFELPNNTIQAGDTTVITLPDKLKFNQTAGFDITDNGGNVVAHAVINGSEKTITLTYTDYAENHSDVSGNFYFYVQIDRDQVDEEETIPLEIDVSGVTVIGDPIHFIGIGTPVGTYLAKGGWQVSGDNNRQLRYQLQVNTVGERMQNVTITDKIASAGFTIDPASIVIWKGTWVVVHGDWNLQNETNVTSNYEITWNEDGSFTINLGDVDATDGFVIRYTAVADYDLADGEAIRNDAVIRGDNIRTHTASANATYYEAGGSAGGYVYTIHIQKMSEDGSSLAGVVFDVVRVANGSVAGRITTDSSGEASISGLLKDEYQLVEVSAPAGYILLTEPVSISPEDFGSDKTVLKTITNEVEKTRVSGTKTWDDNDDQDGARPESITVRLLADGTETDSKTVTEADDWSWSFEKLPKYENGREIVYSITEDAVSDYTTEYSGYDVTNTHTPGKTSLTVSKAWNDGDNQDGVRPESVTVKLLADGTDTGKTVELSDANNWTASFADLDEYQSGQAIDYAVEEVTVTGYTTIVTGDAEAGYTITNSHEPEVIEVSGTKTWDDNDDQDGARPESITVRLLADGTETDSKTVTEADDWSWSFEKLPKYENGREIVYSITEDAVSDYTTEYSGYDVINTHTPGKTSLTVSKSWDDDNNKDGSRPESVIIQLLADGKETGKIVKLSKENNWTGSFSNIEIYEGGKEIRYSVKEQVPNGYKARITGDTKKGFIVVNSHTPKKDELKKTSTPKDTNSNSKKNSSGKSVSKGPKTGDRMDILIYLAVIIVSTGVLFRLRRRIEK